MNINRLSLLYFFVFVKWRINICGLINVKHILVEKQKRYDLTHNWRDEGVHTFPKGISLKLNVIPQIEFELN